VRAVFATGQSVLPGPGRGWTTFRRPVPSFPELAQQVRARDQDGRHSVVPHRPAPSHAIFRCLPLFFARPSSPLPSLAVLFSYLPSPGSSCITRWGSSPMLRTAVLGIQRRGRTSFCRHVSPEGLCSPPNGPTAPDGWEQCVRAILLLTKSTWKPIKQTLRSTMPFSLLLGSYSCKTVSTSGWKVTWIRGIILPQSNSE